MTAVEPWKDVRGPSPEDVIIPARTRQGKNKTVAANHVHEDPIPCDMALPESFQIPFERMVIVCGRGPPPPTGCGLPRPDATSGTRAS